jgi:hypothetical protein
MLSAAKHLAAVSTQEILRCDQDDVVHRCEMMMGKEHWR